MYVNNYKAVKKLLGLTMKLTTINKNHIESVSTKSFLKYFKKTENNSI